MRKALLTMAIVAFAVVSKAQTTVQEYNYCHNSYYRDFYGGRSLLQGYDFVTYKSAEGDPDVKFYLMNTPDGKTHAVIAVAKNKLRTRTIVFPIHCDYEGELWKTTLEDLAALGGEDQTVAYKVSAFTAIMATEAIYSADNPKN